MPASQEMITARQEEVAAYQLNITNYTALVGTLPNELPAHLEPYRTRSDKHAAIAEIEDLDDVALLSDVWFRAECNARIRSEMVEMRKAQAILSVLEA